MRPSWIKFAWAVTFALMGIVVLAQPSAKADAPIADSGPYPAFEPASAGDPGGAQYLWWLGADGTMYERWYSPAPPGAWNGPAHLTADGHLGSSPAATVINGQEDVYWEGTDGNLWEDFYANGRWQGATNRGYGGMTTAPGVGSVYSTGEQFVFWRGSNGDLWEAWYYGGWHGPADLGFGPLGSQPTVAVDSSGNQYVFWRGTDGILREAWFAGTWYGPVIPVRGTLGSAPSATIVGGTEEVFWAGTDGNLWETWWTGTWNGPVPEVLTAVVSAPSAAAVGAQTDVFWQSGYGGLQESYYTGNWNGPVMVAGPSWHSGASSSGTWWFVCGGVLTNYNYTAAGGVDYSGNYQSSGSAWLNDATQDEQSIYVPYGAAWWMPCAGAMGLETRIDYYQNGNYYYATTHGTSQQNIVTNQNDLGFEWTDTPNWSLGMFVHAGHVPEGYVAGINDYGDNTGPYWIK